MAGNLTQQWRDTFNKASATFSKEVKNAADRFSRQDANALKSLLDEPWKETGPLVDCLEKFEELDLQNYSEKGRGRFSDKASAAKAALAKLEGAKKGYIGLLDHVVGQNLVMGLTAGSLKTHFPDTYRQVRILKTEAEAVVAIARNDLDGFLKKEERNAIVGETIKRREKENGLDEASADRRKAINEEAAMKQFVLGFSAKFRSSMAKGAAVIQKIKASPDVDTYNREMANGGRDISQNLGNLQKLKAHPKFRDTKLAKSLEDPAEIMKSLERYGNGDRRSLKQDADPDTVQEALKDFSRLYKSIAASYREVLAGKA
ncbi:MAG: hypothetical protein WBP72_14470 [Rhodocyclaceae bacterium]